MIPQDTPPAPAEVCERLREAADALHHEAELSFHIKAMQLHRHAHNITAALLLIEQGEKERDRLAKDLNNATKGLWSEWELERASYKAKEIAGLFEAANADLAHHLTAQLAAATERVKLWQKNADRLVATFKAHEVETLDCDRSGRTHCDCLERAIKLHEELKKTCEGTANLAERLAARAQPTPESK